MKGRALADALFVIIIFGLIYAVVSTETAITGHVIEDGKTIILSSPADNTATEGTEVNFMFQYYSDMIPKSCSLIINGQNSKTIKTVLSNRNNNIDMLLSPGTYYWSISCIDRYDSLIISPTRKLVIEGPPAVRPSPGRTSDESSTYQVNFISRDEVRLENIVTEDIILISLGTESYKLEVARTVQDYTDWVEFIELMTPNRETITLHESESAKIDLNRDGVKDIEISLDRISYMKSSLIIKKEAGFTKPAIEEPKEITDILQEETGQENTGSTLTLYLILAFIIAAVILIITTRRRSQKAPEVIKPTEKEIGLAKKHEAKSAKKNNKKGKSRPKRKKKSPKTSKKSKKRMNPSKKRKKSK